MAVQRKQETKENVYPHSQAKLDLYKNYLLHYLKVLSLTPYCSKINLFDIFCGIGVYKDGNIGSPIITNNCIRETNEVIQNLGKQLKPITVTINDYEEDKINNVQAILEANKNNNCVYEYFNKDADNMLDIVASKVNSFKTSERSLVFIDPYGYSHITSNKIYDLIKNEHTEIILFLPVMQMYRFADIALTDTERACYEDLRKFIFSFFPSTHKIHSDKLSNVFEFIHEIKQALSFDNKFYTCSHYIERGKNNYYALFFITSNLYGLDKMVEAKWKLDPVKGKGFTQKKAPTLFDTEFEETDNKRELEFLKEILFSFIKQGRIVTNAEIYELSLVNEFRATHAKAVLDDLIKHKKIEPCDLQGNYLDTAGAYYLDYNNYKKSPNKVNFKIK
ncbi:MAG: three-Cys-motif partner protein TcmP [Chitinophagaceae bacterium]|nr:three-Cys-motif partner protein TcmP [Chitinophagaceae bacterium]